MDAKEVFDAALQIYLKHTRGDGFSPSEGAAKYAVQEALDLRREVNRQRRMAGRPAGLHPAKPFAAPEIGQVGPSEHRGSRRVGEPAEPPKFSNDGIF